MRIRELLENEEKNIDEIVSIIKKNCSNFLNLNTKKMPIFRGIKSEIKDNIIIKNSFPKDRRPSDTPYGLASIIDDKMKDLGFRARRLDSLYVTGNYNQAEEYAKSSKAVGIIFPIGDFSFTWSNEIHDFYSIDRFVSLVTDDYIEPDFSSIRIHDIDDIFYLITGISDTIPDDVTNLKELITYYDMSSKEFYLKFASQIILGKFFNVHSLKFKDINLGQYILENYSDENLPQAIDRGNEIMLSGDSYYMLSLETGTKVLETLK